MHVHSSCNSISYPVRCNMKALIHLLLRTPKILWANNNFSSFVFDNDITEYMPNLSFSHNTKTQTKISGRIFL